MYKGPTIDMIKTGANITALRKDRKISVKVLQESMGFNVFPKKSPPSCEV